MKYLTMTETNELLHTILEDNKTYGTILKLMYLYGKDFKQIIELKWQDIAEDSITFKGEEFPLSKADYLLLREVNEDSKIAQSPTYVFFNKKEEENIEDSINLFRKRLIYYFNNNVKQLDLPSKIKYSGLSLTDLRRLRGQHLIISGVGLNVVMELYQQHQNYARTQFKKFLQYDDLYKLSQDNPVETVEDIFKYCSDTEIFQIDDLKNNNQFLVTNMEESTLMLIDYDNVTFIEQVSDKFKEDVMDIYQNTNLLDNIKGLQPSQYKLLNEMKFIKV